MPIVLYAGADVRVDPSELDPLLWDDARRRTFLLRLDVRRPLSIDRYVWPAPEGLASEMPLPWVGVEDVRNRARQWRDETRSGAAVIVIGAAVEGAPERDALARTRGIDAELVPLPAWVLLGYDVADGAISGLCNCGYDDAEAPLLRSTWAPRLNEHGLLATVGDAIEFRAMTDARVPEHAPFCVYGLWLADAR